MAAKRVAAAGAAAFAVPFIVAFLIEPPKPKTPPESKIDVALTSDSWFGDTHVYHLKLMAPGELLEDGTRRRRRTQRCDDRAGNRLWW